jgi:hypothetical protein
MQLTSKNFNVDLGRQNSFLILLPLSKENVSSYLSPILGLYSIKPSDFFEKFILQFNAITQFKYNADFVNFLANETSYLSTVSITVPLEVSIINIEKVEYNILILQPSLCALKHFFNFSRVFAYVEFPNISIKKIFLTQVLFIFLYGALHFYLYKSNIDVFVSFFHTRLLVLLYKALRLIFVSRGKSILKN